MEDVILDLVVGLLFLFCILGIYLEIGCIIQINLGCFGLYIVYDQGKDNGKDYCFLKVEDNVLIIILECVLELLV